MAANYQQTYVINANLRALCDVIRSQGFADQLKIVIVSEVPWQTGTWYELSHGLSWSSWGETINIGLTPMGANATQVRIHSKCDMPTQIIDWGKNRQIVESIYQHLETYVNRNPVMPNNVQDPPRQTTTAFCPWCGTPVATGSRFCGVCGSKLN